MSKVVLYNKNYKELTGVDWDFISTTQDSISKLHPYPARFIESIPHTLIELVGVPEDSWILDPFCGSGTTLLEAQKLGEKSIGIDLNPIACLISRVKTQYLPEGMPLTSAEICTRAKKTYNNGDFTIPPIPNLDHWFKSDVQKAMAALIEEINKIKYSVVQDALRFSLSSIIVRVSNQESDTRYAAIDKKADAEDVFRAFAVACKKLAEAKQNANYQHECRVLNQDILQVTPEEINAKIGLVITSPPYPNAYEYWLYHKYRMWWLGYDPIDVRKHEIGARPHYQKKNGQTEEDFCKQMDKVFRLFESCVVYGGHVCIVIGRSVIKGRIINNSNLISKIGAARGFELVVDIERAISAVNKSFNLLYGKIKNENILVFRKAGRNGN